MEKPTPDLDEKTLSASKLCSILRNPTAKFIKDEYGGESLYIDGYTIEDENLILDDTITVHLPLIFNACTFKSVNPIFISGLICNESLTFEGCTISDNILFHSGTFKKEVVLKYIHAKNIDFNGGTFEKISISGYNINQVRISGAKFESLFIGEYLKYDNISKLIISLEEDKTGDIFAYDQSFDKLSIHGINKGKKIRFERLKCNDISLSNFKNEGSLNFYGIEPKDFDSDQKYIQIINSNLDKAEFYRTSFSQYKELIIIDSFITDALFIGCKWSNNIRALYGPGYPTFEDSLISGRKTSPKEIVAIKEAYRQLKISMSKHSDKIQELKFYSEELNFHNKTLTWGKPWENEFWDKLILCWSKFFSDYGQSFIKPLFWLLIVHFMLFIIALLSGGLSPLSISFCNATADGFREAFEKFFIYINPLRNFEISFSGYLVILDFTMRIWSSYMIYNLIRASRRFIS
ncbi:MAG: hypothetical protein V4613_02900 [Bacteroidota bacterium]